MDIASGVLGIGVGLNDNGVAVPSSVPVPVADAQSTIFSNFTQVDNLYFKERTQAPNGCRAIYFPVDDRYTYFLPLNTATGPGATLVNTYNTGFYFAGYGQGINNTGSNNLNSIRFDFYVNYEALVQPQYNNFIPSTPANPSGIDAIKTASDLIASSPNLVTKDSSDIPALGKYDVGSFGALSRLTGGGNSETILPDINVIRKAIYKHPF